MKTASAFRVNSASFLMGKQKGHRRGFVCKLWICAMHYLTLNWSELSRYDILRHLRNLNLGFMCAPNAVICLMLEFCLFFLYFRRRCSVQMECCIQLIKDFDPTKRDKKIRNAKTHEYKNANIQTYKNTKRTIYKFAKIQNWFVASC